MSRISYPNVPAINHARDQSRHGPAFDVNHCLMETEIAFFGTHGFGGETASLGWDLCEHKHPIGNRTVHDFLQTVPRGFPLWFKGGSPTQNHPGGDGHVVITGVIAINWTVDRLRNGFWDRTSVQSILDWNHTHPLRIVGWSEDIGGKRIPYKPHSKDPIRK